MSRKDAKRCQLIKMVIEFAQQISIILHWRTPKIPLLIVIC
ncbi:MAG: hypothetical protein UZ01_00937 [Candidatus Brocadia sinica]|nr:MAG: hypothetical protein UZ01_00937 [Candidatus Brocadia sinica]